MHEVIIEPKGFHIVVKTLKAGGAGDEDALQLSVKELCERIEKTINDYSTFDSNQQVAVTIQTCDLEYAIEESIIALTSGTKDRECKTISERNYWIGE